MSTSVVTLGHFERTVSLGLGKSLNIIIYFGLQIVNHGRDPRTREVSQCNLVYSEPTLLRWLYAMSGI